ncbi:FliG C-terminal domain-containing protein [Halovulum sp. GXIMD14793]
MTTTEAEQTRISTEPGAGGALVPAAQSERQPAERQGDRAEPWEAMRQGLSGKTDEIDPINKAAIILTAIGPELAGDFLKSMNETSLTRIATAISGLDRVPAELLDSIIAEFLLSIGTDEEVSGGSGTARRLLGQVLDDNSIEKIMYDVEGGDTRAAWKKLNDCTPAQLSVFIGAEHPQTATVILSELRPDKAAGVIERLDNEFAQQCVFRLSRVPALDNDVAEMVERVIARDFLSAIQRTKRSRRPADVIAGLMNNLTAEVREKFIAQLEEQKPALAAEVLRTMFTFADIHSRVEPRDVAIIAKEVDEPVLLLALKWAVLQSNPSYSFIVENISKRLSERLVEEVESMPDCSQRDGESAHQEVVRQIQAMAKAGTIQLLEEEGPDE